MPTIDTNLSLTCIENILLVINEFVMQDSELVKDLVSISESVFLKTLNYIYQIAEYSLKCEKKRGESFEDIQKRIMQNKQKKNKYKSYI